MSNDLGYNEACRADYARQLPELGRNFTRTNNPVHAWAAVAIITTFNSAQRARARDGIALPELEWPSWLLEYLGRSSMLLMRHLDEVVSVAPGEKEPMTPGEIVAKLPSILRFTRDGWNAFDEMKRLNEAADLLNIFEEARARGSSRRDAMGVVLEASGLESERAIERRWQRMRKAWGDET